MELSNILFIDIETVSQFQAYESLDFKWQSMFERKIRYFQEKEPEKSPDQLYHDKAAIYAEFGKIVCIGLGFFHKGQLRITTLCGDDEAELIEKFFQIVQSHFNNPDKHFICGHNIKEFDVPYICRRALINGIALPALFNISSKKPWELKYLLDTLDMWKFGDQKNYVSLELLTACFNLETSKSDIDGSMVGKVYYEDHDLKRIGEYCSRDVWVTANVFLKMSLKETIPFESVHFTDSK
ncbi:MAG: 3'-5' exonuclease [Saprospiraceae bacterium]